jgi:hypothetical protein
MMTEIRAAILDGTFADYRKNRRVLWAGSDEVEEKRPETEVPSLF